MVADGGEARPHLDVVRVPARPFGRLLDRRHAALRGLLGEEGVQDHLVEAASAQGQRLGAEGHETERQVLVDGRQVEDGPRAGGPVVADDELAPEETLHDPGEVLEGGGGDAGDAVGVLDEGDAPTEAEHEPAAGQALHRPGQAGGDHRVAGVVIGGRGDDGQLLADRTRGPGQDADLLLVEALRQEDRAEAHRLGGAHLVDQVAGAVGLSGQSVETQFGEASAGRRGHGTAGRGRAGDVGHGASSADGAATVPSLIVGSAAMARRRV